MSTHPSEARIPELTLGWRLKMSLGDLAAQDMASYLGVSRQTVTRWCTDTGTEPKRAYILQWAMKTGVDAAWLETGKTPTGPGGPGEGLEEYAIRDSNPEPADMEHSSASALSLVA